MKTLPRINRGPLPESFEQLNALHPLRPITDEAAYENVVDPVDRLAVMEKLTFDQATYLATLTELVAKYDQEHYAAELPDNDPIETLTYRTGRNEMSASALGELLGNRSLGSKLLRGERQLGKAHIRTLAEGFKVNRTPVL